MKKSELWTILIPILICVAILTGVFIGRITSGDRIYIEKHEDSAQVSGTFKDSEGPVDINTANADLLTQIPGIGDVLARRIVDYREKNGPFTDVNELLNISGIGDAKLKSIIAYIRIGD